MMTENTTKNDMPDSARYSRINFLTLLVLGIFIVIIGAAAYYFTLSLVRGELRLKNVKIGLPLTNTSQKTRPINNRITILISEHNQQNLETGIRYSNLSIQAWRNFLIKENIAFDTISDHELENGKIDFNILILPDNPVLSELAISRITEFLSIGGGLIASGDCGFMDEKGEIRQLSFLNRIIGINKINEIDQSIKSYVPLTLKTNSPLTIDVPLGAQLGLNTEYGCIWVKIIENRTIQDGYFYDPEVDKGIPLPEIENSTGLCHGAYGKGRFVWLDSESLRLPAMSSPKRTI